MAKDLMKEGLTFALGMVRITGEQFNNAVKKLERRNRVSSKEGKGIVLAWVAEQQRQLKGLQKRLKREALRTRLYSSKDLANLNKAVKRVSAEIAKLQKKKKTAEKAGKAGRKGGAKKALKRKAAEKPVRKKKKR